VAKSSKPKTLFRCSSCGASAPKWAGQCSSCGEWNTLAEERDETSTVTRGANAAAAIPVVAAAPMGRVPMDAWKAAATGIDEFDRVLGGGLVPGSVTLLGGEPGIGKSTLLLQLLASVADSGRRALLISGEESAQQVRLRAERLEAVHDELWLAADTSLPDVLGHLEIVRPTVAVVDSVQTLFDPTLSSAPGSVTQVRDCSHAIVRLAKEQGIAVLLVGHVTKEGSLAGPRVLEHLVDTVLSFEGDRHHGLRLLRAVKHRFGATGELGMFEMRELGLCAVADPSAMLLGDRQPDLPGSIVVPAMDGHRPLLVEVQALVGETQAPMPRRSAQGIDGGRLALLLAVLEARCRFHFWDCEVYTSIVGGVRITEPAADLGVALAIASAASGKALLADTVAIGEIGLGGELRQVQHAARRLSEAARLGFTAAVVPASTPDPGVPGLRIRRCATLGDAVTHFGLRQPPARRSERTEKQPGLTQPTTGRPTRPVLSIVDRDDDF
jgi:DNA repair protein RadA/Sms